MAGSLALMEIESTEKSVPAFKDQWEVSFSRFVVYPSLASTCSSLVPLPNCRRRPLGGTWISSQTATASLQLIYHSISDAILSVSFSDCILEEHYVSKLHFTWPHVSCLSGYPPRGSRAVFVSYRDSLGEFQKFAFRFASVSEAEKFINELKDIQDIMKDFTETEPPPEISSASGFVSTNRRSPSRVCEEESIVMSPIISNSDQLPLNLSNEVEEDSNTNKTAPSHLSEGESSALPPSNLASFSTDCNEMILNNEVEVVSCNQETAPVYNQEVTSTTMPPSFASFLANCYPEINQATAQTSSSDDNDLKSEIARLMEDTSFQEMLIKVEKVINEIGDDLML